MTRMQIIAKTVLTVLGIYTILTLCRLYAPPYVSPEGELSVWWHVAFFAGFTPLATLVVVFLIFNNDGIARKMAGPGPIADRQTQTAWLIRSLRVGLVLTGLMLLPKSIPVVLDISYFVASTFKNSFRPGIYPDILGASARTRFEYAYNLIKAVLALYLICGAPHFVRRQARHSLRRFGDIEQPEMPDSCTASPERTLNE